MCSSRHGTVLHSWHAPDFFLMTFPQESREMYYHLLMHPRHKENWINLCKRAFNHYFWIKSTKPFCLCITHPFWRLIVILIQDFIFPIKLSGNWVQTNKFIINACHFSEKFRCRFSTNNLYPDLNCIWIGPELLKTLWVENKIKGGFNVRRQSG